MPTKTEQQIAEIKKYRGPVKIFNTDTMEALDYAFIWGYTKTLEELTSSITYKDLIKTEIDFVIAVGDQRGYSICRQARILKRIYDRTGQYKSNVQS